MIEHLFVEFKQKWNFFFWSHFCHVISLDFLAKVQNIITDTTKIFFSQKGQKYFSYE